MKFISSLLFVLLSFGSIAQQFQRDQLRNKLLSALDSKPSLDSLFVILENKKQRNAAEESYLGLCNGLYCNYDSHNWAKMKHVLKAKNHLNKAVEMDSNDPELRFMRFMLEHFLPSFLGLNKNIEADLQVIFKHENFIDNNPALKRKAVEFLLWTKRCSPEQTRKLQLELEALNGKQQQSRSKNEGG